VERTLRDLWGARLAKGVSRRANGRCPRPKAEFRGFERPSHQTGQRSRTVSERDTLGRTIRGRFSRIALGLLLLSLLGGILLFFEDRLIYFPERYPGGSWDVARTPAKEGEIVPRVEDCFFPATDGVRLHGWFCSPLRREGGSMVPVRTSMVLLWFHGNAGNITHRYDMIRALMAIPAEVFIVDYRGYGRSDGSPSEKGLYSDARGAWDYLVGQRDLPAQRVVLFGKSLGGAVAVDLATQVRPAGLIVQSSFTSIPDMAASLVPFFPRFLMRTRMDSLQKIPLVGCPTLFIHSPVDEIVPYRLGRKLFGAAAEPKRFCDIPGAPHNETYLVGGEAYLECLRSFVLSCGPVQ
jgi:uncharacterized protein